MSSRTHPKEFQSTTAIICLHIISDQINLIKLEKERRVRERERDIPGQVGCLGGMRSCS